MNSPLDYVSFRNEFNWDLCGWHVNRKDVTKWRNDEFWNFHATYSNVFFLKYKTETAKTVQRQLHILHNISKNRNFVTYRITFLLTCQPHKVPNKQVYSISILKKFPPSYSFIPLRQISPPKCLFRSKLCQMKHCSICLSSWNSRIWVAAFKSPRGSGRWRWKKHFGKKSKLWTRVIYWGVLTSKTLKRRNFHKYLYKSMFSFL